ncbi:hypothetical protein H0I29_13820 [Polaribacter sp. R2A056_3_33]|uniref:hypothetical protein n=1 Tax=Polaribacter sp. R2A056_3_33 TaxID=2745563 RepID=UPI001C4FD9B1|nr:hypothetical protein [Polaribacter sp. R2A056_3_33]QXP69685.1 hypothetical protein H0I29_13820 [Polaribacter sp. R2A056_3_33]
MITISLLLILLASLVFYNTSKKALLLYNSAIETWIQVNKNYSKAIALLFLIVSLLSIILIFGFTSGIIFWLISFISFLSTIVIIYPLKIVNYKHLIILFLILLVLELIT